MQYMLFSTNIRLATPTAYQCLLMIAPMAQLRISNKPKDNLNGY